MALINNLTTKFAITLILFKTALAVNQFDDYSRSHFDANFDTYRREDSSNLKYLGIFTMSIFVLFFVLRMKDSINDYYNTTIEI